MYSIIFHSVAIIYYNLKVSPIQKNKRQFTLLLNRHLLLSSFVKSIYTVIILCFSINATKEKLFFFCNSSITQLRGIQTYFLGREHSVTFFHIYLTGILKTTAIWFHYILLEVSFYTCVIYSIYIQTFIQSV